jgi:2-C-methyl-D-erythritol 4-phosphate cytidylyltransferase
LLAIIQNHHPKTMTNQPITLDYTQITALIPAAGSGERLGLGPKAFLSLHGQTLVERAVAVFQSLGCLVIIGISPNEEARALPTGVEVVFGGDTRQQTVYNMLLAAQTEYVMVHDAARPFLPLRVIEDLYRAMLEYGAATTALGAVDTLVQQKNSQANNSQEWGQVLDRSQIWAVQTPQGFRRQVLLAAHQQAMQQQAQATDDAGLVARLGHLVKLVAGDSRLFKLTRPDDWALAQAFAPVWDKENQ